MTYPDQEFQQQGCALVPSLFAPEEVAALRQHYMSLRASGSYHGDFAGVDPGASDPLKRYPRMIHVHRWDERSLAWMLDPRVNACVAGFLGREPFAGRTMLYFKPPGARGQGLHQDQFVFFFNGSLVHGSFPNRSPDRFRRALIGHYVAGEAEEVAQFYHPVLRMDGTIVQLRVSERGGPCGVRTEREGRPEVALAA